MAPKLGPDNRRERTKWARLVSTMSPWIPHCAGFFHLPGTSTYMKFGGFVKADLFYDLNYAGTYYGAYVPSSFPSSTTPHSENSTVSMRPTRFTWETRQGTLDNSEKEVKVYFEFDFLSNYDRNSIRLRQFYGQYKNFLAGQAWSAFSDPDAFPDTLEFEGPPGIIALRNPQFRYTQPLNKHHSIGVSVEKSGTDTPFSTQFGVPIGTSKFPDLIGFYRYENNHGHLYLPVSSGMSAGSCPMNRCSTWHGTPAHSALRFPEHGASLLLKTIKKIAWCFSWLLERGSPITITTTSAWEPT